MTHTIVIHALVESTLTEEQLAEGIVVALYDELNDKVIPSDETEQLKVLDYGEIVVNDTKY